MSKKDKSKKLTRTQRKKRETQMRWLRYGGLAALVIAALAIFGSYRQSGITAADDLTIIASANIQGSTDAPISIVEFGDFGCHACRAWHNSGTKEAIQAEFGDQISFTFRHYPVITRQSPKAAEASQCAADQDAFWEYHDFLYEEVHDLSIDQLKSYASVLELDTAVFNDCLDSGKHQEYVERDLRSARNAGATGTPTFFVNGQLLAFPSYQVMANAIRAELGS